MAKEEKLNLKEALASLQKKYGKASIGVVEDSGNLKIEMTPTGLLTLDYVLGGGLAKGRIYEFSGVESSGKSLTSLFIAANIQKIGGTVALIDAENAFNSDFAAKVGVDVDKLILSQETCLESVFDQLETLVRTNEVDLIIVDSVASLVPKDELEGALENKEKMAQVARLLSRGLRNLVGPIAKSKTVVIFINQIRDNLDMFSFQKTVTPGGKALKFYSSVRIEVKKGEKFVDKDKTQIGNQVKIKVIKNKVGFPFREGELDLYYDKGVDTVADVLNMAMKFDLVTKNGATYYFVGKKLAVGIDNCKSLLEGDVALFDEIREATKKVMKPYESDCKKEAD